MDLSNFKFRPSSTITLNIEHRLKTPKQNNAKKKTSLQITTQMYVHGSLPETTIIGKL
jgi:hypothetical protein